MIKYIIFSRKDIFLDIRAIPIEDDFDMYVVKGHNYFAVSKSFFPRVTLAWVYVWVGYLSGVCNDSKFPWLVEM